MDSFTNPIEDFIPPREIPRRRLIHSGIAQQKFRRAVLEAAAEISAEFSEHYWKDIVNKNKAERGQPTPLPPPSSNQSLKQRFVFYLNASGRYLVLREHLRRAVSHIVQQRCLNLRPSGFQSHRDFQTLLHDMYNYLIDEVHETLNRTQLQEGDPLEPAPPKLTCNPSAEPPSSQKELGTKTLLRQLLFYAEESFVQGDFDNCHKIHLSRICRSREDSNCWLDFALMWLTRGDDRMAEIAVREALRRDPTSIFALVIGGIIAARHKDTRGVAVLAAALEMKPLSPELLVILALAHIAIGAEEDSDYFFRKAAYLHRTLTGQSTQGLDELLTKLSKSVGLVESVTDILRAEMLYPPKKQELEEIEVQEELYQPEPEPVPIPVRPSARFSIRDPNSPPIANERKSIAPSKKKSLLPRMSIAPTDAGDFEIVIDPPSARTSEKRRSSDMQKKSILEKATKNSTIPEVIIPEIVEQVDEPGIIEVAKVEEEFYTRKVSLSREEPPKAEPLPHPKQPKFDFIPDLSDLIVDDSILPPLRPSIFVPWNVTEYSNRLRDLISQSGADDKDKADLAEDLVDEEEESVAGVAPLNVIKAEYDQLVKDNMESTPSSTKLTSNGSKKKLHGSENDIVGSQASKSELRHKSSSTTTTMGKKSEYEILEIKHVDNNKKDGQDIVVNELFLAQKQDGILPPSQSVVEDGVGGSGDSPPVFVNRLGSELIWAGQLLLQLRMFDMLDGVLTRELYITGKRSIQFLYLRAMSFYLRRCQREAIPVIDEALALDPENPVLWILRGHCFYELQEITDALTNYETALRMPVGKENRHLLYLRFGSLALDSNNYDTAKRVFLYGIQKYPTPYLWLAIGNTCYTMGNYDEAEAAFAEANRLDNTNPITWAHLALINLACDRQALAEQSYKWAMRFGLKKGKVLEEIRKLQIEKGFGDPSFPRIPTCIPHDYYVRRLGRQKPFDIYRDALLHETPAMGRKRFDNTERENALRDKLRQSVPSVQKEGQAGVPETAESELPITTAGPPTDTEDILTTPERKSAVVATLAELDLSTAGAEPETANNPVDSDADPTTPPAHHRESKKTTHHITHSRNKKIGGTAAAAATGRGSTNTNIGPQGQRRRSSTTGSGGHSREPSSGVNVRSSQAQSQLANKSKSKVKTNSKSQVDYNLSSEGGKP